MRPPVNKKVIKHNEAMDMPPIHFSVPPAHTQVQTVDQEPVIKFNFKDYYKSNVPDISKAAATSEDSFFKKAADYIREHEGYSDVMYDDGKGNWTIGIGHLLSRSEYEKYKNRILSDEEIQEIFKRDLKQKIAAAKREFGSQFDGFSDDLKIAIVDGYFRSDLPKSPRTIKLLKAGRFKEAAIEYLDHDEYRASKSGKSGMGGIASRMERNAAAFKNAN